MALCGCGCVLAHIRSVCWQGKADNTVKLPVCHSLVWYFVWIKQRHYFFLWFGKGFWFLVKRAGFNLLTSRAKCYNCTRSQILISKIKFWGTWSGPGISRSSSAPQLLLGQTCECLTTHSRGNKCPSCGILSSENLALTQTSSWPDLGLWPKNPRAEIAHLG